MYGQLQMSRHSGSYSPLTFLYAVSILSQISNDSSIQELNQKIPFSQQELLQSVSNIKQDNKTSIAANIFSRRIGQISSSFMSYMKQQYNFTPEPLISVSQVNDWCSRHTNGKVKEIVKDVRNIDTAILSAFHFKDEFKNTFNTSSTYEETFHGTSNTQKQFMRQTATFPFFKNEKFSAIKMSFKNSKVEQYFVIPNKIDEIDFDEVLKAEFTYQKVYVKIPKTKLENTLKLKEVLQQMGIQQIFARIDATSTLGSILAVDEIIQKNYISISEEGTEAASVTGIFMAGSALNAKVEEFIANVPFITFLVYENEILMVSSVVE